MRLAPRRRACVLAVVIACRVAGCGGGEQAARQARGREAAPARPRPRRAEGRAGRAAHRRARPDAARRFKRSAVTVKINNTQAAAPAVRRRPGRRRLRRSRRGRHHAPRRDLQLARPRPSSARCARCARPTRASCGRSAASSPTRAARRTRSTASTPRRSCSSTRRRAGPLMYRDHVARTRPYNLFAHVDQMYSTAARRSRRRRCSRTARANAAVGGTPVDLGARRLPRRLRGHVDWDAASGTWLRSIFGAPDVVTRRATQLAPKNVVVMFVHYVGGARVHGIEARGRSSPAPAPRIVFTGGKEITGTWTRPDKAEAREAHRRDGQRHPPDAGADLGRAARRRLHGDGHSPSAATCPY